jgi:hypothetical protein
MYMRNFSRRIAARMAATLRVVRVSGWGPIGRFFCRFGGRQIGWRFLILAGLSTCFFALTLGFSQTAFAQPAAPTCRTPQVEARIKDLNRSIKHYDGLVDAAEAKVDATQASYDAQKKQAAGPSVGVSIALAEDKETVERLKKTREKFADERARLEALPPCPPPPPPPHKRVMTPFDERLMHRLRTGGRPGSEELEERQEVGSSGRTWSGPSFGFETFENFGRVRTKEALAATDQTTFESTDSGDPLGIGVVVGYTFAPSSNALLVGPFLSMDFLNQTINHNFAGGAFFGTKTHWVGTLGAKVGVAPTSNLFVYGLFGGSVLNEDLNINFGGPVTSQNVTVTGFTSGFGAAFKPSLLQGFGMPVSVFAQYQHTWWADANLTQPAASPSFNYNFRREDDTLRFGVNLQFGGASPSQPSPPPGMPVKAQQRY